MDVYSCLFLSVRERDVKTEHFRTRVDPFRQAALLRSGVSLKSHLSPEFRFFGEAEPLHFLQPL